MSGIRAWLDDEERETTVILLPDDVAAVDRHGNLIIQIRGSV